MPSFTSLQQFFDTITARLTKSKRGVGGSEGVVATDVLEAMKDVGRYAEDVRSAAVSLNAGFVARSLSSYALIYVQGDVGNDSRTGETFGNTNANGPVQTLARVAQLHSNKTQSLFIEIRTGIVDVSSMVDLNVPEVFIYVWPNAALRFRKRPGVLDTNNVVVGEGTWPLRCFSNIVNVRVDGQLVTEAHAGSTGNGDQYFYRAAQGGIAICGNPFAGISHQYQSVLLSMPVGGSAGVGVNTTMFVHGHSGTNVGVGSQLANYKRSGSGTVILATNATETTMALTGIPETLVFEGSGSSKSVNVRRTYAFQFSIVYNDGCTITVQPAAACSANVNNLLTFTGAVGKTITVRITANY